jgi:hypothetical protein
VSPHFGWANGLQALLVVAMVGPPTCHWATTWRGCTAGRPTCGPRRRSIGCAVDPQVEQRLRGRAHGVWRGAEHPWSQHLHHVGGRLATILGEPVASL